MKLLSAAVACLGLLALFEGWRDTDPATVLLGGTALMCAVTTFRARAVSAFLKIFVGIFSAETIVLGVAVLAGRTGLWPAQYSEYLPPEWLPPAMAIFSMLVYAIARVGTVAQIMRIADPYFETNEISEARVWPFRPFAALERRIAMTMIVLLVLLNQALVGVVVRLNFFVRDWFNSIQNHNSATFWHQLLFVFVPWAAIYVAIKIIEFFTRSMLVIRWRLWLTNHFVSRWLSGHNHYRISLVAGQADNPDQRIAEDVHRFINGGSDGSSVGYGLYDFSV